MKIKPLFKFFIVLKMIILFGMTLMPIGNAFAMYPRLPMAEVAQSADIIFVGTVVSKESRFNKPQTCIFTEIVFDDIRLIHQTNDSSQKQSSFLTLTFAGGCVGDVCLTVGDAPDFQEGGRYLVFLTDDGKQYANPITGGSQGLFRVVTDDKTGESYVMTAESKSVSGADSFFKTLPMASRASDGVSQASYLTEKNIKAGGTDKTGLVPLSVFIKTINENALKVELTHRILQRGRQGAFIRKDGVVRALDANGAGKCNNEIRSHVSQSSTASFNVPFVSDGELSNSKTSPANNVKFGQRQGGRLGWCGYQNLPLVMEMVPESSWAYDSLRLAMCSWNRFMDIYRIRSSNGTFGSRNQQNEFCGWINNATLNNIYGFRWNGALGLAVTWWQGNECSRILESDVMFNSAYDWTDDDDYALGNSEVVLLRPVAMHELGHTWGMQRGPYAETYDYDVLTVMHSAYSHIVEDGVGIHRADAYSIRRAYSDQTGRENIVDVGIESYYADDGLHNSTTNRSNYSQGDPITIKNITVENNSYNSVSNLRVRFFLSRNRIISTQDRQIGGYWYWNSFSGERYSVFDANTRIPDNIPSGTYHLGAIVTINGYGNDDYTSNNKTSFFRRITIGSGSSGNPRICCNPSGLSFSLVKGENNTAQKTLNISNCGSGTLYWGINETCNWLNCDPSSGTNSGSVAVTVNAGNLSAGTYTGTINIYDSNASNSPRSVAVNLTVSNSSNPRVPFGEFATPENYSTVMSSIPVTGWALDDVGVASVKIYVDDNYVGDAVFVEGARPDIVQAYPDYPNNNKAGWGYMMLTNFLPGGGNGYYWIDAIATDVEGNEVVLGSKRIYCDNAHAVKPFGAIDTPTQGGTASGSTYSNWGWVLTPRPNKIPTNGSTIKVWVDGKFLGNPTYNMYRADIAGLFPGYANSNGAVGRFTLNTRAFKDGVHEIYWTATDNAGHTDGIGSRYFTIKNSGGDTGQSFSQQTGGSFIGLLPQEILNLPFDQNDVVTFKTGFDETELLRQGDPGEDGTVHIRIRELDRVVIGLNQGGSDMEIREEYVEPGVVTGNPTQNKYDGYMVAGNRLHPLPAGSTMDRENGLFCWHPGPGFTGTYNFIFVVKRGNGEPVGKKVRVQIESKFGK